SQRRRRFQATARRSGPLSFATVTRRPAADFARQLFLGAGDRVLLIVKQLFDSQSHLHVSPAIGALTGPVFLRRQHWKLSFPVTQHVGLHSSQIADLANFEKEFFRNCGSGSHLKEERDSKWTSIAG